MSDIVDRIDQAVAENDAAGLPPLARSEPTPAECVAAIERFAAEAGLEMDNWQRHLLWQVYADPQRGWLSRWVDRIRGGGR